jgi:hypothetical protein
MVSTALLETSQVKADLGFAAEAAAVLQAEVANGTTQYDGVCIFERRRSILTKPELFLMA